ncbi:hypothetical protein ACLOJK_026929 [Asimina triloba]
MMLLRISEDEEDIVEVLLVGSRFTPSIAKEGLSINLPQSRSYYIIVTVVGGSQFGAADLQRTVVAINGDAEGSIVDFHAIRRRDFEWLLLADRSIADGGFVGEDDVLSATARMEWMLLPLVELTGSEEDGLHSAFGLHRSVIGLLVGGGLYDSSLREVGEPYEVLRQCTVNSAHAVYV